MLERAKNSVIALLLGVIALATAAPVISTLFADIRYQRERIKWTQPLVLANGEKVAVIGMTVKALPPARSEFSLSVQSVSHPKTEWTSIGDGRFVLRPLGLRVSDESTLRLVTRIAGGTYDYGPYPLAPDCSAYYVFNLTKNGWIHDRQGPSLADMAEFSGSFNLLLAGGSVGEPSKYFAQLPRGAQRLVPSDKASPIFYNQPCPGI